MGYWKVERNVKHSIQYYMDSLPHVMRFLSNRKLIFLHNEDNLAEHIVNTYTNVEIITKNIPIESLPTWTHMDFFLSNVRNNDHAQYVTNDKGLVHYNRELCQSGEHSFKKIHCIWTSKVPIICEIIEENPFNTDYFSWIDFGYGHWGNIHKSNTTKTIQNPSKEHLYYSRTNCMSYKGKKVVCSAGFFKGHKQFFISWLKDIYWEMFMKLISSDYCHDEETILTEIIEKYPSKFISLESL